MYSTIDFSKRFFILESSRWHFIILLRFTNSIHTTILLNRECRKEIYEVQPKKTRSLIDREFRSRIRVDPGCITKVAVGRTLDGLRRQKPIGRWRKCLKMHHNYHGSPLTSRPASLPHAGGIRSSRLSLYQAQTFLFMAAGSRPRRVMILFRPVLRIYAIGDSDKPRKKDKKGEKKTKIKSPRCALNGEI